MKIKIYAIMIVVLFVSASAISIVGAEELQGTIDVKINDVMGGVAPKINLTSDQTIYIMAESDGVNYTVNTTLSINFAIEDNSGRGESLPWGFPRWAFVYTQLTRPEQLKRPFFPIFGKGSGLVYRIVPLLKPILIRGGLISGLTSWALFGGTIQKAILVESILGEKTNIFSNDVTTSVDIPLHYDIKDMTGGDGDSVPKVLSKDFRALEDPDTIASEKVVLRIATIGFPASNINGFKLLDVNFIDYQQVNLTVNYYLLPPID